MSDPHRNKHLGRGGGFFILSLQLEWFRLRKRKGRKNPAKFQNDPCKGIRIAKKVGFLCLLSSYQRLPKSTTQYQQQRGKPMLKNRAANRLMREFCAELRAKYKLPPNTTNNAVVYDVLTLMNRLELTNSKAQRLCKMAKLRKAHHDKQKLVSP